MMARCSVMRRFIDSTDASGRGIGELIANTLKKIMDVVKNPARVLWTLQRRLSNVSCQEMSARRRSQQGGLALDFSVFCAVSAKIGRAGPGVFGAEGMA